MARQVKLTYLCFSSTVFKKVLFCSTLLYHNIHNLERVEFKSMSFTRDLSVANSFIFVVLFIIFVP